MFLIALVGYSGMSLLEGVLSIWFIVCLVISCCADFGHQFNHVCMCPSAFAT
jgi:hypothetical protein